MIMMCGKKFLYIKKKNFLLKRSVLLKKSFLLNLKKGYSKDIQSQNKITLNFTLRSCFLLLYRKKYGKKTKLKREYKITCTVPEPIRVMI